MSFVLARPTCNAWDHTYSILSGQVVPNEPSPSYMGQFDDILCDFLREQGVPGAALSIHLHGKPIYKQGYGMNRPGEKTASTSKFRIASISKVLTAVGIMQLVEEGKLSLDTSVFMKNGPLDYLRSEILTYHYRLVTVRHLLEHSAGWDREQDEDHVFWYQMPEHRPFICPLQVVGPKGIVPYVLRKPFRFEPGTKHSYSNFGYLLLGLIIERVTGLSYEDYMCGVLRQIGITDMYVGMVKTCSDYQEVRYYNNKEPILETSILPWEGQVVPQYGSFPMRTSGAYGGWVSNAENVAQILDTLVAYLSSADTNGDQWLTSVSVEEMLKAPSFVSADDDSWYGLGLDIEDNGQTYGHTGAMEGSSCTVCHYKNGLTWSFLLNAWSKDMDLDGLIKFALMSVSGLPICTSIWSAKTEVGYSTVMSEDGNQTVRILLPHNCLYSHVSDMRAQGYMISHISAVSLNDEVLFAIVWSKPKEDNVLSPDWCIVLDITLDDFENYLFKLQSNKFRVLILEPYTVKGEVFHLFVFDNKSEPNQVVYCVEEHRKHNSLWKLHRSRHYMCISQSVVKCGERTFISCIFNQEVSPGHLLQKRWTDLEINKFVSTLGLHVKKGFKLTYLQFYSTQSGPKISAIWQQHTHRPIMQQFEKDYNVFQRHDVTKYGLMYELRETMQQNLPVLFLSSYEFEGVVYFVSIWDTEQRGAETQEQREDGTSCTIGQRIKVEVDETFT